MIQVERVNINGVDTMTGSGWTIADTFDIRAHFFTKENREKYRSKIIWDNALEEDVSKLLKD